MKGQLLHLAHGAARCVFLSCALIASIGLASFLQPSAIAQQESGSMSVQWFGGSTNCSKDAGPPLQVHKYNANTFIIRENLCETAEAPFMYLLIGSERALLIDTGDVADPKRAPLAKTVLALIAHSVHGSLPLLVVHTHRHLDHRAGDVQFSGLSGVTVVPVDFDSVRRFYRFRHWPDDTSQIELGGRTVDVLPTPGHNRTEVSFYDRDTGLFFSGDFMLPGRLLIDNQAADLESAERVANFVDRHQISFVLGGHIELNSAGKTFPWGSHYHPHEHVLQMNKHDLLALPAELRDFNGFYRDDGKFVLEDSLHILTVLLGACLIAIVSVVFWWVRRARNRRLRSGMRRTRSDNAVPERSNSGAIR